MDSISISFDFTQQTEHGSSSGIFSAPNVTPKREKYTAVTSAAKRSCELKNLWVPGELRPSAPDAINQSFTITFTNIERRGNARALW
jgi:hypothetical protein